jgi:membrane dipeptidase
MLAERNGDARAGGGLTELGRTMVREANRLGILLDVSHLSVKSFWDLIETSSAPIIASHSNAKALCNHPRNLDDDQIRAVVASGGTVGVTMVPAFITQEPREATLARLVDHIDYIAGLVGPEHLAIGPDYVNFLESWANRAERYTLAGLEEIGVLPNLTAMLLQRGYDERAIRGILGENFLRVLTGVIG